MKKVLVVEDNKHYRELLTEAFEEAKIPYATAEDGRMALGVLEKDQDIHLILLDLLMSGVDGIDFYHLLEEKKKHIPIIVLTNLSDTAALGRDIKEVLIKSNVSLDEVVAKVKAAL